MVETGASIEAAHSAQPLLGKVEIQSLWVGQGCELLQELDVQTGPLGDYTWYSLWLDHHEEKLAG